MCFVLDINCFHLVFDSKTGCHSDFRPLFEWLYDNPRTCLVIGGNTYREELGHLNKYFDRLVELKRAGKLAEIRDDIVDAEEKRLKAKVPSTAFNDAHIVAIFCSSGCQVFASHDRHADTFITMKCLYPSHQRRPRIYRSPKHKGLLCKNNIVALRNLK
jgi:predicted nucleic acid-binding protein